MTAGAENTTGDVLDVEEVHAPPSAEPLLWRNSFLNYTHQVSVHSFAPDAQLSYNPVWEMGFTLLPRFYLPGGGFLRGNLGLWIELTDSDVNARNREPLLTDGMLDYVHPLRWEVVTIMPSARLVFPTSRASLAAQRVVQTAIGLTVVSEIEEAAHLTLAASVQYGRWWAASNVVRVDTEQPERCPRMPAVSGVMSGGAPSIQTMGCDQLGTATAGRDQVIVGLSVTMTPIGAFSLNASAFLFNVYGFELAPAHIAVASQRDPLVLADASPSHWRNFTYVSLSASYQMTAWLNLSLGVQNAGAWAPARNPNGTLRNPLLSPDTQVFLTGTLGIDEVYSAMTGSAEADLSPEERLRRQRGFALRSETANAL